MNIPPCGADTHRHLEACPHVPRSPRHAHVYTYTYTPAHVRTHTHPSHSHACTYMHPHVHSPVHRYRPYASPHSRTWAHTSAPAAVQPCKFSVFRDQDIFKPEISSSCPPVPLAAWAPTPALRNLSPPLRPLPVIVSAWETFQPSVSMKTNRCKPRLS